ARSTPMPEPIRPVTVLKPSSFPVTSAVAPASRPGVMPFDGTSAAQLGLPSSAQPYVHACMPLQSVIAPFAQLVAGQASGIASLATLPSVPDPETHTPPMHCNPLGHTSPAPHG